MNIPKQRNAFLNLEKFILNVVLSLWSGVLKRRYDFPNITEDIITNNQSTTLGHASALRPSKPKSLIFEVSLIIIAEKQSKNIAIIISDLLLVILLPRKNLRELNSLRN
tara:strand:+ start:229 stop:555 length:327 start_codon:yes stop_codon:yes gene_type:complete